MPDNPLPEIGALPEMLEAVQRNIERCERFNWAHPRRADAPPTPDPADEELALWRAIYSALAAIGPLIEAARKVIAQYEPHEIVDAEAELRDALAAFPAAPGSGWRPIGDEPAAPVQVEFFFGNLPHEYVLSAYRDERRQLGFWDGDMWCEMGTGHHVFEDWRTAEYRPTHYRVLPAPPSPTSETSDE